MMYDVMKDSIERDLQRSRQENNYLAEEYIEKYADAVKQIDKLQSQLIELQVKQTETKRKLARPGNRRPENDEQRRRIVKYLREGYGINKIVEIMHCSNKTVSKWNKVLKTGMLNGRPYVLDENGDYDFRLD